ncbi:MAG: DUF11 domain-containing protein, partial [Xanthomonadales bacterium]|nr:DUF11 domain-containing protein [Xanthomonadales bacterium]
VGDTITYSFSVENTGDVTLTGVSVNDPLLGGTIACAPATLAPGSSATCGPVDYTVTAADVQAGHVANTATASGTPPTVPGNPPPGPIDSPPDSTDTPIAQNPALTLEKSVTSTGPYGVGDTITYSFSVENTGDVTLTGVSVNDPLLGGTIACAPATLAPGATASCGPVNYTVTVADVLAGSVHNTATASGTPPSTPANPTPTPVTDVDDVTTPVVQPGVSVAKSSNPASGSPVAAGDTITYTLTATVSDVALTDPLVLTDTLSGDQTFGTVTSLGSFTANTTGAPTLMFTLASGTVPGTYSVSYTATVDATATGTVGNSVVATGGTPPGGTPPSCTTCSTDHPITDPVVSVAKSSNPASGTAVAAGDTITYTLTATVSDAALVTDLVLTDTLSGDQTFGTVTSIGSFTANTAGAPTLVFTLPNGTVPGTYSVSYTATVDATATGIVGNGVVATGGTPPGGTPPSCTTCTTDHPITDPVVNVVKSSNPASGTAVAAGDTITYTLTATVSDAALVTDLVLTDTLSGDQTFGTVTSLGSFTANTAGAPTLVFTLPSATVPGTYSVSYTATVDATATGNVGNSVAATGGTPPGGTPPSCTTCSTDHPITDPVVSVAKNSNPASGTAVAAGDTITYTLTATVSDAALVTDLVLTDTLSGDQTFGTVTSPGDFTANTGGAPTLVFTLPSGTVPGTYAVTYTATVDDDATGNVGNSVVATGGTPPGGTPPGCTDCSTTHPLTDPAVTFEKASDPASGTAVNAGDTIGFTLTVNVANSATLSDVVLTDTLGAGLTLVSGSLPSTCSASGQVVTCTLAAGATPAGSPYTFAYQATVDDDATTSVANGVTATGGGDPGDPGAPDPECASVGACETTHPLNDAAVTYAKSANPANGTVVAAGDTIGYTLTVNVANSATLSDVVLTDTLGSGLTLVPGSLPAGCSAAGNVVTCTLPAGATPAGSPYTFAYQANVDTDATVSVGNSVVATGGGDPGDPGAPDPDCSSAGACETTHPLEANVSVTKALTAEDGTRAGIAEPGEALTYTITLANTGGVDATGVGVTDPLDANVVFVSASNGGSHAGGVVTWSGLTVPANGTLAITVAVEVLDPIPPGVTQIANLAYLTGSTPPLCPPGGPQCVVTPTEADISVTKAVSGESIVADGIAEPGEEITYTITVRNDGGTATTGTLVNEVVPEHTTFVSGSPAWSCPTGAPAGTACDALVNVPAHDGSAPGVATLTFTVRVDDPLPAGVTTIANAVAVNDGTPPDCGALPTSPACAVMPTVNLRMTKTVASVTTTGPSAFLVSYRIEVVNLGGAATTYTLTDTLGFAPGVVYTGNAQVSTSGGTVNPALPGGAFAPVNGTVVQLSASNTGLAVGATHEYLLRVPVGVQPGALQDAACDGTPGHGFHNEAHLAGSFDLDSAACAPVDGSVALIHLVKQVTLATDHNGNRYGDVGDVLGYTFTISNPGTLPLSTVYLFDPRVQNLSCPAFTVGGQPFTVRFGDELFGSGFEFRAGGGTLQPGDSVVCSAGYTLTAADVANGRVVNTATATGTGPAGQTVSSVATAIFTQFR